MPFILKIEYEKCKTLVRPTITRPALDETIEDIMEDESYVQLVDDCAVYTNRGVFYCETATLIHVESQLGYQLFLVELKKLMVRKPFAEVKVSR